MSRICCLLLALLITAPFFTCHAQNGSSEFGNYSRYVSPHFSGPGICAPCHDGLYDDVEENDVSIVRNWSNSLMAFAFIDPLWQAKVESEVKRLEALVEDEELQTALTKFVEKKCATCHAPTAATQALFDGEEVKVLGDGGFNDPDNPYHLLARDGISCTLCHQIEDGPYLGGEDGISGNYVIPAVYEDANARPVYGQYEFPFATSMQGSTKYLASYSEHIHEAAICATCHDLKTPYLDSQGNVAADLFPEQLPFAEWLESDYSDPGSLKTCQDCHMLRTAAPMSRNPRWIEPVDDFARHAFISENRQMLTILDQFSDELGIEIDFDAATEGIHDYLGSAAEIEITDAVFAGGDLQVKLQVTNHNGHKLPTSIPTRRVFIHFRVTDESGEVIFNSGQPNDNGSVSGVAADEEADRYETHHDTISTQDQVMVYEGIMGNTDGQPTYTLLRAAQFLKDNRIPPAGFDKNNLNNPEVQPVGNCMEDDDFTGGSDSVLYVVSGLEPGNYHIEATLYDQTLSYRFIEDLFSDDSPLVSRFERMYDAVEKVFEVIDETSADVIR